MATLYTNEELLICDVAPEVGKKYLWFQHCRSVLVLTILEVGVDIKIKWQVYLKLMSEHEPMEGEVVWNMDEWKAVTLKEFAPPVQQSDLKEDEELCHLCNGMRWYFERDSDITSCMRCDDGRMKKLQQSVKPTKRSDLHPTVCKL
jgi:hypothetical protein